MRLVDIEEIHSHILEKNRLIFGLGKSRLRAALGLFQALFQPGSGNAILTVLNSFFKLGDKIPCRRFDGFRSGTNALERGVGDDDGVRRIQGGLGHKPAAVVAGEIFLATMILAKG